MMCPPTVLVLVILAVSGAYVSSWAQGPAPADARLFDRVASVMQHPRCTNCHANAPFPRQKDIGIPHAQLVVRGADGHGTPALRCRACHQASNTADGKVPGAGGWHMPPPSMGWGGLTKAQVCAVITDPAKNGGRTLNDLIDHIKSDLLVLWAWNPGAGRTSPVYSHEEFVQNLEAWVAAGGPCPVDGTPEPAPR
jgi:hypothetical protein